MLRDLVVKNRSYRRFSPSPEPENEQILSWIDLARLSPSSRNAQALKFAVVTEKNHRDRLFPSLAWAGYLTRWKGPEENERPTAYILVLGDKKIASSFEVDAGIACQSILLGAVEDDFGGCILGAVNRKQIRKDFNIPDDLHIVYVIALGRPSETVILEDDPDSQRYYRDESDRHHVPKRPLEEIIQNIT